MVALDVDFDVFKTLTNLRATEMTTYNDVLRELLKLGGTPSVKSSAPSGGWTWKGVHLPNGTELKAEYKGKAHTAKIADGSWRQNGEIYYSPSAAASAITDSGINGWRFWSVKRPSDATWTALAKLREGVA